MYFSMNVETLLNVPCDEWTEENELCIVEALAIHSYSICRFLCEPLSSLCREPWSEHSGDIQFWSRFYNKYEKRKPAAAQEQAVFRLISTNGVMENPQHIEPTNVRHMKAAQAKIFIENLKHEMVEQRGFEYIQKIPYVSEAGGANFFSPIDRLTAIISDLHSKASSLKQSTSIDNVLDRRRELVSFAKDLQQITRNVVVDELIEHLEAKGSVVYNRLLSHQNSSGGWARQFDEKDIGSSLNTAEAGLALKKWESAVGIEKVDWQKSAAKFLWANQNPSRRVWLSLRKPEKEPYPYRTATVVRCLAKIEGYTKALEEAVKHKPENIQVNNSDNKLMAFWNRFQLCMMYAELKAAGIPVDDLDFFKTEVKDLWKRAIKFCRSREKLEGYYWRPRRLVAAVALQATLACGNDTATEDEKDFMFRVLHQPRHKVAPRTIVYRNRVEFRWWVPNIVAKTKLLAPTPLTLKSAYAVIDLIQDSALDDGSVIIDSRDATASNWAASHMLELIADTILRLRKL